MRRMLLVSLGVLVGLAVYGFAALQGEETPPVISPGLGITIPKDGCLQRTSGSYAANAAGVVEGGALTPADAVESAYPGETGLQERRISATKAILERFDATGARVKAFEVELSDTGWFVIAGEMLVFGDECTHGP